MNIQAPIFQTPKTNHQICAQKAQCKHRRWQLPGASRCAANNAVTLARHEFEVGLTLALPRNRVVGQAFQPAGSRDFLVPCSGIWELPTGKSPEPAGWKACVTILPPLRFRGSMRTPGPNLGLAPLPGEGEVVAAFLKIRAAGWVVAYSNNRKSCQVCPLLGPNDAVKTADERRRTWIFSPHPLFGSETRPKPFGELNSLWAICFFICVHLCPSVAGSTKPFVY